MTVCHRPRLLATAALIWAIGQVAVADTPRRAKAKAGQVFEQRSFTFTAPAGWKRTRYNDRQTDAWSEKPFGLAEFESSDGYFVRVFTDPPETEFYSNGAWRLGPSATGDGLVILAESPIGCLQMAEEEDCTPTPGFVLFGWVELKGRAYVFLFGHMKSREADLGVLREVLKAFRAK